MQSETIGKLAEALSKAQGSMRPATMDRDNPYFKSKYATLTSLWESARKACTDNGLSVTQTTDMYDGELVLVTTLMHTSGEWISGAYPLRSVGTKPQELGSAMTYARRYSLGAILGLSSDEDDDGNAASGTGSASGNQVQGKDGGNNGKGKVSSQPTGRPASEKSNSPDPTTVVPVWDMWVKPDEAYVYALSIDAFPTEEAAREEFRLLVKNNFDGSLNKNNSKMVYRLYFDHVQALVMKQADSVKVDKAKELAV